VIRCLAAVSAAAALAIPVAGCAKFDAALGKQEAVVHFQPGTPLATLLKVRSACSHVPNVKVEALPKHAVALDLIYALRYRTDDASDSNLAQLQECLQKFPSVAGIDFTETGDS
jgi:hypothetical protein